MSISMIAAVDSNYGIGYKGQLLFKIKKDMEFFRQKTLNKCVLMGRKTWESIGSRPLSDRFNIVITHNPYNEEYSLFPNVIAYTLTDLTKNKFKILKEIEDKYKEVYVIGGESMYKYFLNKCDDIYMTMLNTEFKNVDSYFPRILDMGYESTKCYGDGLHEDIPYSICRYILNPKWK